MNSSILAFESGWLILSIAGALLTCTGLLFLSLTRQISELRRCNRMHEAALISLRADVNTRTRTTPATPNERQLWMERQLDQLRARQDQLELSAPESQAYAQAIERVRQGAGIDELIADLGLSRGEAELIQAVQRMSMQH